jgi:hypothetical protein
MADRHISIVKKTSPNILNLVECVSDTCLECAGMAKKLYHCALCTQSFRIRSKLKEHHLFVHWNSRISFSGMLSNLMISLSYTRNFLNSMF